MANSFRIFSNLLFFPATLLISCTGKKSCDKSILEVFESSLISSDIAINISTERALKSLDEKSADFCTKEKAGGWITKAKLVASKTKGLYDYLHSVREKPEIIRSLLNDIVHKLNQYKVEIINSDPEYAKVFYDSFQFIDQFNSLINDNISEVSLKGLLASLQSNIKVVENKIISFCDIKVACMTMTFDSYAVIVNQNSNLLEPGSELEITAGVGAFSRSSSQPKITFKGKEVALNEEGYSIFKTIVSKNPGTYFIPVEVKFTNSLTGKKEEFSKNISYTVAQPCADQ